MTRTGRVVPAAGSVVSRLDCSIASGDADPETAIPTGGGAAARPLGSAVAQLLLARTADQRRSRRSRSLLRLSHLRHPRRGRGCPSPADRPADPTPTAVEGSPERSRLDYDVPSSPSTPAPRASLLHRVLLEIG